MMSEKQVHRLGCAAETLYASITTVVVSGRLGMGMGPARSDHRREHCGRLVCHRRASQLEQGHGSRTRRQAVRSRTDLLLGDRSERLAHGHRLGNVDCAVNFCYCLILKNCACLRRGPTTC